MLRQNAKDVCNLAKAVFTSRQSDSRIDLAKQGRERPPLAFPGRIGIKQCSLYIWIQRSRNMRGIGQCDQARLALLAETGTKRTLELRGDL